MVLVNLPTKLGDFVSANVDTYSSTMDHMGLINFSNPIPHSKKRTNTLPVVPIMWFHSLLVSMVSFRACRKNIGG